jgi:hypothetical protein
MTAPGAADGLVLSRARVVQLIGLAFGVASALAAGVFLLAWKAAEDGQAGLGLAPPQVARITETALRSDMVAISLGAPERRSATDYLVRLKEGDAFAYSWTASDEVSYELHGHNVMTSGAPGDQLSYFATGTAASGSGYFIAPADGFYGWYFQGRAGVVEITLNLRGFYLPDPGIYAVP